MSLLIPTPRDRHDAHGDLEEDNAYYNLLIKEQNSTNNRYIWKFEPVKGFFKQTDEQTDDMAFRYTEQKLGRLDDWEKIVADLQQLNRDSPDNDTGKRRVMWHLRNIQRRNGCVNGDFWELMVN